VKIATFNVNSVKARLNIVLDWLRTTAPDVALLQEIKTVDEGFPRLEIEELGYNIATHGQKSYNGVAILSKRPIEDVTRGLPGDETDVQARYIEAIVYGEHHPVRVASIYLPNGNPVDSEKYPYKLSWLARLEAHAKTLLTNEEMLVLAGDYNVIPTPDDCYDPKAWARDALFLPQTRQAFRRIVNLGLTDAFRACQSEPHRYTFWDYQGGAYEKDHGIRIDHALLSPQAADHLISAEIERSWRGREKASDHVPLLIEIAA
jgi:exodeoxyribonuclease-3